jgi:Bacterial regulatory proteins, luxR family
VAEVVHDPIPVPPGDGISRTTWANCGTPNPLAWPDRRQIGADHIRRELALLALVADGRTNREIAKTLFITERTAGAYVSSILARLGRPQPRRGGDGPPARDHSDLMPLQ